MMIIRRMKEKDVPQVAVIEQELFGDAWSEAEFYESLQQAEAYFLVAETAGKIAGYCGTYRALDEAEIVNVAVSRCCQNGGIGQQLVQQLIDENQAEGVQYFFLEVRKSNASARHVYEKLGFQEIGIRKRFYEQPVEDAVIMQLECRKQENITADE